MANVASYHADTQALPCTPNQNQIAKLGAKSDMERSHSMLREARLIDQNLSFDTAAELALRLIDAHPLLDTTLVEIAESEFGFIPAQSTTAPVNFRELGANEFEAVLKGLNPIEVSRGPWTLDVLTHGQRSVIGLQVSHTICDRIGMRNLWTDIEALLRQVQVTRPATLDDFRSYAKDAWRRQDESVKKKLPGWAKEIVRESIDFPTRSQMVATEPDEFDVRTSLTTATSKKVLRRLGLASVTPPSFMLRALVVALRSSGVDGNILVALPISLRRNVPFLKSVGDFTNMALVLLGPSAENITETRRALGKGLSMSNVQVDLLSQAIGVEDAARLRLDVDLSVGEQRNEIPLYVVPATIRRATSISVTASASGVVRVEVSNSRRFGLLDTERLAENLSTAIDAELPAITRASRPI